MAERPGLPALRRRRADFQDAGQVHSGRLLQVLPVPLQVHREGWHRIRVQPRQAAYLAISANQLHRTLGVTLKTAWFIGHRIREAMRDGKLTPMGGSGGIVEIDETYHGQVAVPRDVTTSGRPYTKSGKTGPSNKRAIVALVERGGSVRSIHVEHADKATINLIASRNVAREARVFTDESKLYNDIKGHASDHQKVRHTSGEYVRGEVHTNTVENVFSVFKRGMKGTYQHCAEKHLHRYLAEFDFRYNNRTKLGVNDLARADSALKGIVGKRLTYRTANQ